MDFCDLVRNLRSHFFAKDRDVILQTGRVFEGQGVIPIGGVIFWPSTAGAIPTGWAVFAALQGRFPVGADGVTFIDGASGGAATINIQHNHGGSTGGESAHTHGDGSYATDNDSHDHDVDSGTTAGDTHNHGSGTLQTTFGTWVAGGTAALPAGAQHHYHNVTSGSTDNDSHSHGPGTLNTDSDTHSHDVTGTSGTGSAHSHTISNDLSAAQSIIPPYHCGQWIQRTS